jgi:hypothetical protein
MPTAPTRLLANVADFEHVWQLIQTNGKARSLYEQLKKNSEGILQQPAVTYNSALLQVSDEMLRRIYTLGLLYRLEGDKRYSDKAWQDLESAAKFPDWNPQGEFLDTAEMTHAFAIGYDWFLWAENQRATLRDSIVTKGLTPALNCYLGKADYGWWVKSPSNWNQVCNGGIGIGALALLPELPELCQQVLDNAARSLQGGMGTFAPDGGWPEGPVYWDYATFYSCIFLAALQTAISNDYGLVQKPGFSDTGLFAIYMTGPTLYTFNFSDSDDIGLPAYQMLWLAREFGRSVYSWYPQTLTSSLHDAHALSLLWFDPEERDPQTEGLPLDKYFRGTEVATFRTAWNDGNAIFVGLKAGDNKANHSHLDAGTFVVDALGKRWALDLGGDNYSLPGYFDENGQRWTYYRTRAEGHNTLVLNPSMQPDQDPKSATKITRFQSEPAKAFAIADLTPAYRERLERGIALANRNSIIVQDELLPRQRMELRWFMHTPAEINLSEDGLTAMLKQDSARLWCAIASPPQARFTVMDAKPLSSSPNPEGQDPNMGIRKLAIHMSDLPSLILFTLSVTMIPLTSSQEPPAETPALTRLANW